MRSNRLIWMGFYWIGVILTLACVALIFGGHTIVGSRLEYTRFPLSWQCGCAAMLAFLAAELCHPDVKSEDKPPVATTLGNRDTPPLALQEIAGD